MAIDPQQLKEICLELRTLIEHLSDLIWTYEKVNRLNLTAEQKELLKNEYITIKQNMTNKLAQLP